MIEIVKNTKNRNLKNADIVRIDIPTIYAEQNLSIARAILIQLAPTLFCSSSARLFSSSSSRARVSLEMASSILEDIIQRYLTTVTNTILQPSRNSNLVFSIKTFHFHPQHLFLLLLQFMTLLVEPLIRGTWFGSLQTNHHKVDNYVDNLDTL